MRIDIRNKKDTIDEIQVTDDISFDCFRDGKAFDFNHEDGHFAVDFDDIDNLIKALEKVKELMQC